MTATIRAHDTLEAARIIRDTSQTIIHRVITATIPIITAEVPDIATTPRIRGEAVFRSALASELGVCGNRRLISFRIGAAA